MRVTCPNCGNHDRIDNGFEGRQIKCTSCFNPFVATKARKPRGESPSFYFLDVLAVLFGGSSALVMAGAVVYALNGKPEGCLTMFGLGFLGLIIALVVSRFNELCSNVRKIAERE